MTSLLRAVREHGSLSLDDIEQAGEHGADSGWSGFTYTSDGADFTREHRSLIWELLAEEAESFGSESVAAHVASFTRSDMAETPDGFDCLLAWWALETVGRYVSDYRSRLDDDEAEERADEDRASTWLLDGNSTKLDAERLLIGLLDGDPEILDELPSPRLSGEWADDPRPSDLFAEAGVDPCSCLDEPCSCEDRAEIESELLDSYSDGFSTGAHDGAETEARRSLNIAEGLAVESRSCLDCRRTYPAILVPRHDDPSIVEPIERCDECLGRGAWSL
jgi:hypothetical protein